MFEFIDYLNSRYLGQKGQGIVAYALVLAFVVIIGVYLITNTNENQDLRMAVYNIFDGVIIYIRGL